MIALLAKRASQVMWITLWDIHLVYESRSDPLDGADTREIVRIHRDYYCAGNLRNPMGCGQASIRCVSVSSVLLGDLKPNVASRQSNVIGVANAKVQVAHFLGQVVDNLEMVARNESSRFIAIGLSAENDGHSLMVHRGRGCRELSHFLRERHSSPNPDQAASFDCDLRFIFI